MRKVQPITAREIGKFARLLEERYGIGSETFQRDFIEGIDDLMESFVPSWLRVILEKERRYHQAFFGQEFDLSCFRTILRKYDLEAINRWQELGLEPHYLPPVVMSQDTEFPGWKVKPENWYYQQISQDKILRKQLDGNLRVDSGAYKLEGITVLVDVRLKPRHDDGKQMFENDNLLGPIIERLREEQKIAKYGYGSQSSRFGISSVIEWEEQVRPVLAKLINIEPQKVRLERAIEANIIPQLYSYMPRHIDGETDTWVWYEEYFEDASHRFHGGDSLWGGLSHVSYFWAGSRWSYRAVRPLVVLDN